MADDGAISSFDESGYTRGPCKIVFSAALAREAEEQDVYLAGLPNGAEVSVGRALLTVLQEAVLSRASYIHINAVKPMNKWRGEFRVRHRIGSKLWQVSAFPIQTYAAFCARLKMISSINIAERRVPQFARFCWVQAGASYEMRLSSIPTQFGEKFVINVSQIMGHGDYTEERHQWLDQLSMDDILAQLRTMRGEA